MTDTISKEMRSLIMSRVRSKNTSIEKKVRSLLHSLGFRFRLHRKDLPGKPDIYLPKYKTVIFVHGCFWHRHQNCKLCRTPKSNIDFWLKKFEQNIERDIQVRKKLNDNGIKVLTVWQCEVDNIDKLKSFFLEKITING